MNRFRGWLVCFLLCVSQAWAEPAQVYDQAMRLAASGQMSQAVAMLQGGAWSLTPTDPWYNRMRAAIALLRARARADAHLPEAMGNAYLLLAQRYVQATPMPKGEPPWVPALLATLFPGAGHAWLGRWRDAWSAALLVWPMLALTLWAWKRHMGPVTVFFAILCLWLWSGSIFSAASLSARASLDMYDAWWQGLWQASALPGRRPW